MSDPRSGSGSDLGGPRRRPSAAPGAALYLVAVAMILLVFEGVTQPAMLMSMAAGLAWLGVGMAWVLLFLRAVYLRRLGTSPGEAARWLGIPVLLALTFVAYETGAMTRLRFEASRGALDALVADVMVDRPRQPGMVGLYGVRAIEDFDDSVRVIVGSVMWDDIGFERFADPDITARQLEARCRCEYRPLGGGWWSVTESF